MGKRVFKSSELRKVTWQYQTRFTKATSFKQYQMVFLKSNPEVPMVVAKISWIRNKIMTAWQSNDGELQTEWWSPECLLPYKYAGLLVSSENDFSISLN